MKKAYAASLSLIISSVLLSSRAVFAAPYGMYRIYPSGSAPVFIQSLNGAKVLRYYGGPVISRVKVYAVFWGQGVDPQTQSSIGPFYANILNSGYIDWLSEYDTTNVTAMDGRAGTNQKIGRGSFMGSVTINPANKATTLSDDAIQQELAAQIAAGHLAQQDDNTLYMIYFPDGITITGPDGSKSCFDFGAYHEGFTPKSGASIYYGVMPDCGFGFKDLSDASSHETIESITDPFPTPGTHPAYPQAWNSTNGDEVADLCETKGTTSVAGAGGLVSTVAAGFDNASSACNMGPWTTAGATKAAKAPTVALNGMFKLSHAPAMAPLASLSSPLFWDGK